ncbi:MAG TPA: hypothetical protein VEJ20_03075 [Candidatus Eremiobacteraceae bacterium]|nr:hypothetical protein [Candidatus Eremiobacteraceae bacterium]
MNVYKSLILVALSAMLLATPALALADPPASVPAPSAGHHGGWGSMLRALDLTPQQRLQIKSLVEAYREAHPQGSQPDEAARKQLREQILALLTPEQRTQFEQELRQRREDHEGQGQGTAPSPSSSPIP